MILQPHWSGSSLFPSFAIRRADCTSKCPEACATDCQPYFPSLSVSDQLRSLAVQPPKMEKYTPPICRKHMAKGVAARKSGKLQPLLFSASLLVCQQKHFEQCCVLTPLNSWKSIWHRTTTCVSVLENNWVVMTVSI